jgi:AcrR family transcriptional regulator
MPQILKPEIRDRIIDSARTEFLDKGYEDSSMRRIRQTSRMTVGNLYRYFKNKDELISLVVRPAYNAIDSLVKKLTGGAVTLSGLDSIEKLNREDLGKMMGGLSDGIVEVYTDHRTELKILMMSSGVNKALTDWFTEAILHLINERYGVSSDSRFAKTIARGYAVSIFDGLKEILKLSDLNEEQMKLMIRIYLNSYVHMLNNDVSEYIGEMR